MRSPLAVRSRDASTRGPPAADPSAEGTRTTSREGSTTSVQSMDMRDRKLISDAGEPRGHRNADIVLRIGADTCLRKPADTSSAFPLTSGLRLTSADRDRSGPDRHACWRTLHNLHYGRLTDVGCTSCKGCGASTGSRSAYPASTIVLAPAGSTNMAYRSKGAATRPSGSGGGDFATKPSYQHSRTTSSGARLDHRLAATLTVSRSSQARRSPIVVAYDATGVEEPSSMSHRGSTFMLAAGPAAAAVGCCEMTFWRVAVPHAVSSPSITESSDLRTAIKLNTAVGRTIELCRFLRRE
jgi:hypothetical protein